MNRFQRLSFPMISLFSAKSLKFEAWWVMYSSEEGSRAFASTVMAKVFTCAYCNKVFKGQNLKHLLVCVVKNGGPEAESKLKEFFKKESWDQNMGVLDFENTLYLNKNMRPTWRTSICQIWKKQHLSFCWKRLSFYIFCSNLSWNEISAKSNELIIFVKSKTKTHWKIS